MKILGGHMKRFVLRWAVLFIAANVFGFVVGFAVWMLTSLPGS
jgi:hypothetical protein